MNHNPENFAQLFANPYFSGCLFAIGMLTLIGLWLEYNSKKRAAK